MKKVWLKIRQQNPDELWNPELPFPGRAILTTGPQFYVIVSNDTRKKINQDNGKPSLKTPTVLNKMSMNSTFLSKAKTT